MKKSILAVMLFFSLFIVSCSTNNTTDDNNSNNTFVSSISQQSNIYDKDEYFKILSSDINTLFDSIIYVSDVQSDNKNSTISSYVATKDFYLDDVLLNTENYHISITFNNDNNSIESISASADKDNYINFTALVNIIALNLDDSINIEVFDEKYKLLLTDDIFENDVLDEEEKFKVFKTVDDKYISIYFTMK